MVDLPALLLLVPVGRDSPTQSWWFVVIARPTRSSSATGEFCPAPAVRASRASGHMCDRDRCSRLPATTAIHVVSKLHSRGEHGSCDWQCFPAACRGYIAAPAAP